MLNDGMEAVASKANRFNIGWTNTAFLFLVNYAESNDVFLAEDVVKASKNEVPEPHDNRAWGAIFHKAAKAGLINKIGFKPAKTSHGSPKPLWGSLVKRH
jgi:hypothetical protein